jgi:hypothetical protein
MARLFEGTALQGGVPPSSTDRFDRIAFMVLAGRLDFLLITF